MIQQEKHAIFFDLQGTLGGEPLGDILDFTFYEGAKQALSLAAQSGFLCFIITNQSHIAKGLLTMEEFESNMKQLQQEIEQEGGKIEQVYCCPHLRVQGCNCKKPSPLFIKSAMDRYNLNPENCCVIGDIGQSDMLMAQNARTKGILVKTGNGLASLTVNRQTWSKYTPDYIANDVFDAVRWLTHNQPFEKDRYLQ